MSGGRMSDAEFDRACRAVIEEVGNRLADEQRDIEHAERELDAEAAAVLTEALAAGPVRVRVVPAPTDVHYGFRVHHEVLRDETVCTQGWACPGRRGGHDLGRIGVVRETPRQAPAGNWHVYIEDMGPGDDGNPTRYLSPRHVAVLR